MFKTGAARTGGSEGPALHPITRQSDKTKVPQTLLLADDSVTIQRVIELTFADEDIKVVAVSDGDQAIERIEADPPDIVLVDIGMPGRSGYEVARHIKQSPRLQHIPVLLLAGAFEPVDQAKATAAGCNGVLAKPFEPQLVIARVKELLGQAEGARRRRPRAVRPRSRGVQRPACRHRGRLRRPSPSPIRRGRPRWRISTTISPSSTPRSRRWSGAPGRAGGDQLAAFGAGGQRSTGSTRPRPAAGPAAFPRGTGSPDRTLPPLDRAARSYRSRSRRHRAGRGIASAPERPSWVAPADRCRLRRRGPLRKSRAGQALPPLTDAFAAILAAEQHEPMPALASCGQRRPAGAASSANGGPSLGEDAIEEITRRVLDRLSDRIVRETVADLVSHIAERLVREEIERIKSTIK